MAKYNVMGNAGSANTTAATAGVIGVSAPAAPTVVKILGFVVGPQANSADNTYGVKLRRELGNGTWTMQTPGPTDSNYRAATTIGKTASTSNGQAGVELWRGGYHMRAGLQIVPIPGAEWFNNVTACFGVCLDYIFTQGTDVQSGTMTFEE